MKLETLFPGFFAPLISLLLLAFPSQSLSQPINYLEAREIHSSEILNVSSDQEATSLFWKTFGKTLGLKPTQLNKKGQRAQGNPIESEIDDDISQFMTQVVISIRAESFQRLLQGNGVRSLGQLSNGESPQSQWLASRAHTNELRQFLDVTTALFTLVQSADTPNNSAPPQFSNFARYFDQTYPQLVNGKESWVSILEENGAEAITARFNEYWKENPSVVPPDKQPDYHRYYTKTRLMPVFVSHLVAQSIQLRAGAEYQAGQSWERIRKWKESNQKIRALTRLCGKWQWTVHNHLNHQDHKMTMSFSLSTQQTPGQPQPDIIIMNGDTVYLKWIFPSGYQEDSLLLANRDQRLEGTFRNSRGPHGNISGKRLSNCSR